MILPRPFRTHGEHIAIDLDDARVLFTTRRGGVSEGPFESLNLGLGTDDEPGRVSVNRERVAAVVGVPRERFAHGRQVHGTTVRRADSPAEPGAAPTDADGQATSSRGVAAMVMAADCLPIALSADGAVAMVHAGWRGLANGVIEEGLSALIDLGARGAAQAAIGPAAGGCCYEVGAEVIDAFASESSGADRAARRLDLKALARRRLEAGGVETVHDVGLCTICSDPALFFSHRRDHGVTGRQAGVAWRR